MYSSNLRIRKSITEDAALMSFAFNSRLLRFLTLAFCIISMANTVMSQTEAGLTDDPDPVRLFERGQAAHARGEFARALELYEEAIKVRPEFPEAEFQRGTILVSLNRLTEAEPAFRRAIELRKKWSLPYTSLGVLLTRMDRDVEATQILQQALLLDKNDSLALRLLASLQLRAGNSAEALRLAQNATNTDAPAAAWLVRAQAERATGDKVAAKTSLARALEVEPENVAVLVESADLAMSQNEFDQAIENLKAAERISKGDKLIAERLAQAHERAGRPEEAHRVAEAAGILTEDPSKPRVIGTAEEIAGANSDDPATSRRALEKLIEKNPRNAMLFARLGASYRTDDPNRALEFYHRASELQPENPDYATGYASALLRSRRFADAAKILRQVVKVFPDNYTAHANLATALYEQKRYAEALPEYQWLLQAKPDAIVAHYFIATSHDYLREYPEALASYEIFLARADGQTNQLEIEKVKLRLPLLRRQVKMGEGVKRKK